MSAQPPPRPEEHVMRVRTDTTLLTGAVHHVVTCSCGWEDAGPCARDCAADHLRLTAHARPHPDGQPTVPTMLEAAVAAVEVRRLSRERYVHPAGVLEDVEAVLAVVAACDPVAEDAPPPADPEPISASRRADLSNVVALTLLDRLGFIRLSERYAVADAILAALDERDALR